ncbi:MAG: LemA family protein [Spirochaetales bacterium]|nr:LemA family protein [Spirochaetales bacterium]
MAEKKSFSIIAVLAVLLVVIGGGLFWYFIKVPNKIVVLHEQVSAMEAEIDNQLQRRSDLIPNLVNTVKGYASQEKEIFTQIAEARSKLAGGNSLSEKMEGNTELNSALSRLLVIVENYPNLKSDANFRSLQDQLEGTENRLATARRDYNLAVRNYNIMIKKKIYKGIADKEGYSEKPLFSASEASKVLPEVNFD